MEVHKIRENHKKYLKSRVRNFKKSIDWDTIEGNIIMPANVNGKYYKVVFDPTGEVIDIVSEETFLIHYKL